MEGLRTKNSIANRLPKLVTWRRGESGLIHVHLMTRIAARLLVRYILATILCSLEYEVRLVGCKPSIYELEEQVHGRSLSSDS